MENPIYEQILKELGPLALELYQALEQMADSNGIIRCDPQQIADFLNRNRSAEQ